MAKKSSQYSQTRYVSPKVAAEVLDVSTSTLRRWARAGRISFIKLPNGHSRYDISGLTEVMGQPAVMEQPKAAPKAKETPKPPQVEPPALVALREAVAAQGAPMPPIPPLAPVQINLLDEIERIAGSV